MSEVIRVPFGKLPVNLGDYDAEQAYGVKNRVLLYGCEWESMIDNNNQVPAWLNQNTGVITPNTTHWRKISGNYNDWLIENGYKKVSAGNIIDESNNKTQAEINAIVGNRFFEDNDISGYGRVILDKNIVSYGGEQINMLTQDMFMKDDGNGNLIPNTNTIFVIQYDFVLPSGLPQDIVIGNNRTVQVNDETFYLHSVTIPAGKSLKILDHDLLIFDTANSYPRSRIEFGGDNGLTVDIGAKTPGVYENAYRIDDNQIVLPAKCMVQFEGGSITGGTIVADNTILVAPLCQIFDGVHLRGSWNVEYGHPEWFGAVGDDSTDDSAAIQECVDSFNITKLLKKYFAEKTIRLANVEKSIVGTHSKGLVLGSNNRIVGIHSTADVALWIIFSRERFTNLHFHDFSIQGNNTGCGIVLAGLSNCTFSNINVFSYTEGIGIWNKSFAQYSTLRDCILSNCKTGLKLNGNGWVIDGCYFEGNAAGAAPQEYQVIIDSIAIDHYSGDTLLVSNTRMQNFHYGIKIQADFDQIANNRFEGTGIGIYIASGMGSCVLGNNNFTNSQICGRISRSKWGAAGYVLGRKNEINFCQHQNMGGFYIADNNTDKTGFEKTVSLGEVDGALKLYIDATDQANQYGYICKKAGFSLGNLQQLRDNNVDWQILCPQAYHYLPSELDDYEVCWFRQREDSTFSAGNRFYFEVRLRGDRSTMAMKNVCFFAIFTNLAKMADIEEILTLGSE